MNFVALFFSLPLIRTALKPVSRIVLGLIAIPLFRLFLRRVLRIHTLDEELEKDLEQWFKGALLLLAAAANTEQLLFGWVATDFREDNAWLFLAGRILLAVGVIDSMPDQSLFSIIHPGPPPLKIERGHLIRSLVRYIKPLFRGLVCQHLNRLSPVFAIMTAIQTGNVGWACYAMAIIQYLIIGLVTSRDRAIDVLTRFDKAVGEQRQQLINELQIHEPVDQPIGG